MRANSGVFAALLMILGFLVGWWLSDRPFHQIDDALRYKLDTSNLSLVVIGLLVIIIILLVWRR